MTPRITNRKLESIAKDIEKSKGIASLASSRLLELCVGDTRVSDAHRIRRLRDEANRLVRIKEDLNEAIVNVLLQRRSEIAK